MASEEHFARALIQIIKDAGTAAGEIMIFGAIESAWLKSDYADREDLMSGLKYAGDHGWVEDAGGGKLRLTTKGAKA